LPCLLPFAFCLSLSRLQARRARPEHPTSGRRRSRSYCSRASYQQPCRPHPGRQRVFDFGNGTVWQNSWYASQPPQSPGSRLKTRQRWRTLHFWPQFWQKRGGRDAVWLGEANQFAGGPKSDTSR
jgi:hypothetical protein